MVHLMSNASVLSVTLEEINKCTAERENGKLGLCVC